MSFSVQNQLKSAILQGRRIDVGQLDAILSGAKDGGEVTATERGAITSLLSQYSDMVDDQAKDKLCRFLGMDAETEIIEFEPETEMPGAEPSAGGAVILASHAADIERMDQLAAAFKDDVDAQSDTIKAMGKDEAAMQVKELFEDYAGRLVMLSVAAQPEEIAGAHKELLDAYLATGLAPAIESDRPSDGGFAEDVKAYFADLPLEDWDVIEPMMIEPRNESGQPTVPDKVVESHDYYYEHVESNDWGSVRLVKVEIEGETAYGVTVTTDGDDQYMELFDAKGEPLASGMKYAGDAPEWDAEFGAIRPKVIY